ncbi:MAG: NAD(P)-dependent alcohol dehydrogenase [Thermoanaerobaculales bacterium]|nr:NAD(P)-dependent alcohol dehydrogenase [Thermoanaerobaculales bacterium]
MLEVRDVATPVVGDEEVLVRVHAASLHPDVWHVVRGRPFVLRLMGAGFARPGNPIPGTDMAGVVESVGSSVTRFGLGDAVFGETVAGHQWTNGGAFAEFVAVHQDQLAVKPAGVTFEEAAAVPSSGLIVLQNLRGPHSGRPVQTALVNGAGGGVGALALQILKSRGSRVTAVDVAGKLEMLRALGADEAIDGMREDFTRRQVRYDLIVDVPGNHPARSCRRALNPDGRYVLIGHENYGASGRPVFGLIPRFLGLMLLSRFVKQFRGPDLPMPTKKEAMAALGDLLENGAITPVIDSSFRLAEVREAFRHLVEDELHGKVILTPLNAG